ncbi:ribonuclease P protein component [Litchfieldia salsa]|uniref:Ribonuclease P protein component n=1 Tax=Litchfieldia salsa TaxID=930152 RepID=A0A1H0UEY3_9BACI|nr:ribonuclease P protein component [Litchfieldia salsa]SDP64744.1 ribonuclease P protein component [Litchfieldia salsa]
MKKDYRIKKNKEFQDVFQHGKSTANRQFVVYVLDKQDVEHFRIGLSVSKKIGNAVVRNRVKRLIRQFFLEHKEAVDQKKDYVIIARKPVAEMNYQEVKGSLQHVLKRANVLTRTR